MFQIDQVRKGSSPFLILSILNDSSLHGYAIMREIEESSDGYFTMTASLLYPTLHKMEQEKLIEGTWEVSQGKRRKKIYSITPHGKKQLAKSRKEWNGFFDKLFKVVKPMEIKERTQ